MARLDYDPIRSHPMSGVTPFTYQDGYTYLSILRELIETVETKLIPVVNEFDTELSETVDALNANLASLVDQFNTRLDSLDPNEVSQMLGGIQAEITALAARVSETESVFRVVDGIPWAGETPVGEIQSLDGVNRSGSELKRFDVVSLQHFNDTDMPAFVRYDGTLPPFGVVDDPIAIGMIGRVIRFGTIYGAIDKPLGIQRDSEWIIGYVNVTGTNGKMTVAITPDIDAIVADMANRIQGLTNSVNTDIGSLANTVSENGQSLAALSNRIDTELTQFQETYESFVSFVNFRSRGGDDTGNNANDALLAEIIAELRVSGGGTIYFPAGKYRFANRIELIPGRNPTENRDTKGFPPINFLGDGPNEATTNGSPLWRRGGTMLVMDHSNNENRGSILLDTWGKFTIRNLSIVNENTQAATNPLLQICSTTTLIENVGFRGHILNKESLAKQTGIMFGSVNGDAYGIFQGYGTAIRNTNFDNLKKCLDVRRGTNGLIVDGMVVTGTCGNADVNGGCIHIDGTGDQCIANYFSNIVGEVMNYTSLFNINNSQDNVFTNIQAWDVSFNNTFKYVFYYQSGMTARNTITGIFVDSVNRNSDSNLSIGQDGRVGRHFAGNSGKVTYVDTIESINPQGTSIWGAIKIESELAVPIDNAPSNAWGALREGCIIYNPPTKSLCFWNGTSWMQVSATPKV